MLEVATDLVDLAASGLKRIGARNHAGQDETLFLDPLYDVLDRGVSPAQHILGCWDGGWSRRANLLVEYAKY
jgi:glutamate--cysteine ligase